MPKQCPGSYGTSGSGKRNANARGLQRRARTTALPVITA
ncbi:hypothetical protein BSIN_4905 [Burkholderia singularis]|uniref:Uncharacterized protein n=1 Tax=Burkholderia singularis TaxID=1503053 RepID=A0A238H9V8_9BURK|nr:hypothetical protein BSIN_4905 [Burkholderia singularis]